MVISGYPILNFTAFLQHSQKNTQALMLCCVKFSVMQPVTYLEHCCCFEDFFVLDKGCRKKIY